MNVHSLLFLLLKGPVDAGRLLSVAGSRFTHGLLDAEQNGFETG